MNAETMYKNLQRILIKYEDLRLRFDELIPEDFKRNTAENKV
jgi:hypothetical protein